MLVLHLKQTWEKSEEKSWKKFLWGDFFFQKAQYFVILLLKIRKFQNKPPISDLADSAKPKFSRHGEAKISHFGGIPPLLATLKNSEECSDADVNLRVMSRHFLGVRSSLSLLSTEFKIYRQLFLAFLHRTISFLFPIGFDFSLQILELT